MGKVTIKECQEVMLEALEVISDNAINQKENDLQGTSIFVFHKYFDTGGINKKLEEVHGKLQNILKRLFEEKNEKA